MKKCSKKKNKTWDREDVLEKRYDFFISRWKAIPFCIMGNALILLGMGIHFAAVMNASEGRLGTIFFKIFGIFLVACGGFTTLISWIRILKGPILFSMDCKGITYYYSTFHDQKKVIEIPWKNIESIKIDDRIIYVKERFIESSLYLPPSDFFLSIKVSSGFLKNYSKWKHNLFLNGDVLSIVISTISKASKEKLWEVIGVSEEDLLVDK